MIKGRGERGQALAEYHVLFPMGILLASLLLPAIGVFGRDMYCEVVQVFDPTACGGEAAAPEMDGGDDVEEEEEDDCIVLEQSQGGSQCDQSEDCTHIDVGVNQGTYFSPDRTIRSFVIKAGTDYFLYGDGYTADGCYYVEFADDLSSVTWIRQGSGPNCKDISHTQVWYADLCYDVGGTGGDDGGAGGDDGQGNGGPNGCQVHNHAQGGSQCDQSADCTLVDVGINNGTYYNNNPDPLQSFVIKAGQEYFTFYPGTTNDGCYLVDIPQDGSLVTWSKIGSGPNCKDVSHTEHWRVRLCNPNEDPGGGDGGDGGQQNGDDPDPTLTPTSQPTATLAPTATATPTLTFEPTSTQEPTATPVPTSTHTPTPTPEELLIHIGDLDGSSYWSLGTVKWKAEVTILVLDDSFNPVANVMVSGSWGNGNSGSCSTAGSGVCTIASGNIHKKYSSLSFSVNGLSLADHNYNAVANSDPDGDSNGTSITVSKP